FEGSKTIIIGDMLELGDESLKEHQNIIDFAKSCGFDEIITVGPHFKAVYQSVNAFLNTSELIERLQLVPITKDNILLKASRGIALEKIIDFL
ncbi:MAG: UDP-N-acetylmuramoyl-tripeptide--D-alanyl-D-alanine ligase, partial [Chryseobacterium sp.]|nr:UDP-N-acetylmuramoyl-tripeptide--D-alanyl-D-alanine ligase [Chryseobacterium sp.]